MLIATGFLLNKVFIVISSTEAPKSEKALIRFLVMYPGLTVYLYILYILFFYFAALLRWIAESLVSEENRYSILYEGFILLVSLPGMMTGYSMIFMIPLFPLFLLSLIYHNYGVFALGLTLIFLCLTWVVFT